MQYYLVNLKSIKLLIIFLVLLNQIKCHLKKVVQVIILHFKKNMLKLLQWNKVEMYFRI